MTKIIGIAQLKGGSGKTTVATSLAAQCAFIAPTVLIDCDPPQYSSDSWMALRNDSETNELMTPNLSCVTSESEEELASLIDANSQAKYIVLDAPPRGEVTTKLIVAMSNLVIIPVNASKMDVWATYDTETLVKELKAVKKSRLLLNRYRDFTNSSREVKKGLKKEINIELLKTTLGFRTAYMDSLGEGYSPDEWHDPKSTDEIERLFFEIRKIIGE